MKSCLLKNRTTVCALAVLVYMMSIGFETLIFIDTCRITQAIVFLIILKIFLMLLACLLLAIGTTTKNKRCLIAVAIFNIAALITELFSYITIDVKFLIIKVNEWTILIYIIEQVFLMYMIPVGVLFAKNARLCNTLEELNTRQTTENYSNNLQRPYNEPAHLSDVLPASVFGI